MATHVHRVEVHFGDCDPAGIVFFPNFSRWMDEASLAFFRAQGVPPWRELLKTRGIVGTHLREDNGVAARRSDAASAVGELERLPANPAAVRRVDLHVEQLNRSDRLAVEFWSGPERYFAAEGRPRGGEVGRSHRAEAAGHQAACAARTRAAEEAGAARQVFEGQNVELVLGGSREALASAELHQFVCVLVDRETNRALEAPRLRFGIE